MMSIGEKQIHEHYIDNEESELLLRVTESFNDEEYFAKKEDNGNENSLLIQLEFSNEEIKKIQNTDSKQGMLFVHILFESVQRYLNFILDRPSYFIMFHFIYKIVIKDTIASGGEQINESQESCVIQDNTTPRENVTDNMKAGVKNQSMSQNVSPSIRGKYMQNFQR